MRPLQLTIEGLRSFRRPVEIDFEGRSQIAIIGDTGAGKSSILEAITYALYGQATFSGKANQELMNDTSHQLRVVLRFAVGGATWQVTRVLKKATTGTVGAGAAVLKQIGPDGDVIVQIEQARPVNRKVEEIVGLDCDAFLRSVVLPQGRFARLLVEDRPAERAQILRQVWRTDELQDASRAVDQAWNELSELRIRLDARADLYPEVPETHLAQLKNEQAEAERSAKAAAKAEAGANSAHEAVQSAGRKERTARSARDDLEALSLNETLVSLAPVVARSASIDEKRQKLANLKEEAKQALREVPEDTDGPGASDTAAALEAINSIAERLDLAVESAASHRQRRADVQSARQEAEARREQAEEAKKQLEAHKNRRPKLHEAVDRTLEKLRKLEIAHARCVEREEEHAQAAKKAAAATAQIEKVAKSLPDLEATRDERQREADRAAEHLALARRQDSAAHAAKGLHPGDNCPICRATLAELWQPPTSTGLDEAIAIDKKAGAAAKEAADRLKAQEAKRESATERAADAKAALDQRRREATAARGELAATGVEGVSAMETALPALKVLERPFNAEHVAAAQELEAHDTKEQELQRHWTELDKSARSAKQAANHQQEQAKEKLEQVALHIKAMREKLATIHPDYRPNLVFPEDPGTLCDVSRDSLASAQAAAAKRQLVLRTRQDERGELNDRLKLLTQKSEDLENTHRNDVLVPLAALRDDVNRARDTLLRASGDLKWESDCGAAATTADPETLETAITRLERSATATKAEADKQIAEAATSREKATARLQSIAERLEVVTGTQGSGEVPSASAILDAVKGAAEATRFEARKARETTESFQLVVEHVLALLALRSEVQTHERALGDLSSALKPGKFLKWLTFRRSRKLLIHASHILHQISGGKYEFVDPADVESEWRVFDNDSGRPRSPISLSGGEQFLASLALALGLVEMMARSGGRLESLFLDEGFGTLDSHNLDNAVEALGAAARGGRMVGVISHIKAVAEQVDDVLAVARTATGTQVEWLDRQQRARLAESDLDGMLE